MASLKRVTYKNGRVVYRIVICMGYDKQGNKLVKNLTYSVNQSATPKQQEKEARKYAMALEDKVKYGYDSDWIAGMTGGTANLYPSMNAYAFGRNNFQAANRWIAALQGLISAFAATFMGTLLDKTGTCALAYKIDIALVIIAAICIFLVGREPDHDKR